MTGSGQLSDQAVRAAARNPEQYMQAERYGYLISARHLVKDKTFISLCADGVHVGDEDWLNIALWSPEQETGCFLPPQAGLKSCFFSFCRFLPPTPLSQTYTR